MICFDVTGGQARCEVIFEHDCNATLYTFRLENFTNFTLNLCVLCALVVKIRVIRIRVRSLHDPPCPVENIKIRVIRAIRVRSLHALRVPCDPKVSKFQSFKVSLRAFFL